MPVPFSTSSNVNLHYFRKPFSRSFKRRFRCMGSAPLSFFLKMLILFRNNRKNQTFTVRLISRRYCGLNWSGVIYRANIYRFPAFINNVPCNRIYTFTRITFSSIIFGRIYPNIRNNILIFTCFMCVGQRNNLVIFNNGIYYPVLQAMVWKVYIIIIVLKAVVYNSYRTYIFVNR